MNDNENQNSSSTKLRGQDSSPPFRILFKVSHSLAYLSLGPTRFPLNNYIKKKKTADSSISVILPEISTGPTDNDGPKSLDLGLYCSGPARCFKNSPVVIK